MDQQNTESIFACFNRMDCIQEDEINRSNPILVDKLLLKNEITSQKMMVSLVPNLLIVEHHYLVLSTCQIKKGPSGHKEIYVTLNSYKGSIQVHFQHKEQEDEWCRQLKRFCKLKSFLKKYQVLNKMGKDFFAAQRKKTKQIYTVQVCSPVDTRFNEIQILRTLKHPKLMDLKWVYQDGEQIYLVFDFVQGMTLEDLISQGLKLEESQLASLIVQILSLLKFLDRHDAYHGNIQASSVFIDTTNQLLQIYMINMVNIQKQNQHQKIDQDIKSVGTLLYRLTFREARPDNTILDKAEKYMEDKVTNPNLGSPFYSLHTVSQLDLLRRLLIEPRMSVQEALKHHWFINIKSKVKIERKRKKPLPSIKTIIELCEIAEQDMRSRNMSMLEYEDECISDENPHLEHVADLVMEAKLVQNKSFHSSKTMPQNAPKKLSLYKTIS